MRGGGIVKKSKAFSIFPSTQLLSSTPYNSYYTMLLLLWHFA